MVPRNRRLQSRLGNNLFEIRVISSPTQKGAADQTKKGLLGFVFTAGSAGG